VTIQPGDIIVGDADGVIVLPPGIAAEVLADAQEQERQEEFIASRVALGEPIEGLFPLSETRRPDYEAWLRQQPPAGPAAPGPAAPVPAAPLVTSAPPGSDLQGARWNIEPHTTGSTLHRAGAPDPSQKTADTSDTPGTPEPRPGTPEAQR
jgi:hypothetical protein